MDYFIYPICYVGKGKKPTGYISKIRTFKDLKGNTQIEFHFWREAGFFVDSTFWNHDHFFTLSSDNEEISVILLPQLESLSGSGEIATKIKLFAQAYLQDKSLFGEYKIHPAKLTTHESPFIREMANKVLKEMPKGDN